MTTATVPPPAPTSNQPAPPSTPTGLPAPDPRAAQEARDREVFKRLSAQANDPAHGAGPGNPSAATAQPTQPPLAPAASSATAPGSAPSAPPAAPDAGEQRRELEAIAKGVMTRAGIFDADEIDAALKLPTDKLTAKVGRLREKQSTQDRLGNKVRELEARMGKGAGKAPNSKADSEPADEDQDGEAADDGETDPLKIQYATQKDLARHYRSVGDTDAAAICDRAALKLKKAIDSRPPSGPNGPAGPSAPANSEQSPEQALEKAVADLRGPLDQAMQRFPQLKEHGVRRALVQKARSLIQGGAFSQNATLDDVIMTTAGVIFPREDPQTAQRRLLEQSQAERSGFPEPPQGPSSQKQGKASSREDRDRAWLRHRSQGKSAAEATALTSAM